MKAYNLLTTIINSPLLAFFFYSLMRLLVLKTSAKAVPLSIGLIDVIAMRLVLFCSAITLTWTLLPLLISLIGNDRYATLNRAFGPYWFAFWWYPLILIITQLLWLKKFRNNEAFRFMIGVLLMIQPYIIEKIVILTLRRDYVQTRWLDNGYLSLLFHFLGAFVITSIELVICILIQRILLKKTT